VTTQQPNSDQIRNWLTGVPNDEWVDQIIAEHVAAIRYAGRFGEEAPRVAQLTWTEVMRERKSLQQTKKDQESMERYQAMREFVQQYRGARGEVAPD
jgi:hypothetical protein